MYVAARIAKAPVQTAPQILWRSPRLAPETAGDLKALTALRAETMRVAAVTAAATSIAVHLTRAGQDAAAQFSTALMRPAFSPAAAGHVATLTDGTDREELAQAWLLVQAGLAEANQIGEAQRKGEADAFAVRAAWQRASRTLLEWFALMQPLMLERGAISDAAHDAPTLALLRRAAAGETPALHANGPFALPSSGERRRETRHTVSVPVTITSGTRTFEAHLGNISTRGVLVVTDRAIPAGRTIKMALADGRTLEGKVCWSNVRQIGVALTVPLAADDALWTEVKA